ncbi:ABC transporter permease [Nocardia jinanensis]|uniref:ABC transporter permease n=1 Tax=Nocardia jinanensis TaxID=382504 RepID=A0A917RR27_9NOCA|nr:ABC transporter permease [Nocardia jinanensis]GGL19511.1 ABC transporter permease [Nocardia jinanensis]
MVLALPRASISGPTRRRHSAQLVAAGVLIGVVVLVSLFAPLLAPYDPLATDPSAKFLPPGSSGHLLGTDDLGRDLLSRLLWGGRTSLLLAVLSVAGATVAGSVAALLAGFAGPRISGVVMRLVDMLFAFPVILVAVALAAVLSPGAPVVVVAIVFYVVPYVTRVVFTEVKQHTRREYVEAATALGATRWALMVREVLPNVTGQIVVYATGLVATMVVFSASLSAVGIGVQPPTPDWGQMIASGAKVVLSGHMYVALIPGLTVVLVALAFNWLGDGLHDLASPRNRGDGR